MFGNNKKYSVGTQGHGLQRFFVRKQIKKGDTLL